VIPKYRAYSKICKVAFPVLSLFWDWDQSLRGANLGNNDDSVWYQEIKDIELMQWTGLVDKNGNEIYTGHIVKLNGLLFKVVMEFCQITLICITPKTYSSPYFYSQAKECEIVGSIYENPELLEGADHV
jgi:uncharacterized phage protein (TIGR01671 family)